MQQQWVASNLDSAKRCEASVAAPLLASLAERPSAECESRPTALLACSFALPIPSGGLREALLCGSVSCGEAQGCPASDLSMSAVRSL